MEALLSSSSVLQLLSSHHHHRTFSGPPPFLLLLAHRLSKNHRSPRTLQLLFRPQAKFVAESSSSSSSSNGGLDIFRDWFAAAKTTADKPFQIPTVFTRSSAVPGAAGGGGGGISGGEGGGSGGDPGNENGSNTLASDSDDALPLSSDIIVLDVGGMSCGGCAANVKRILESQSQVSSATVNLVTETAVVHVVPEGHPIENWKESLGEKLAVQLTSCGFKSSLRTSRWENMRSLLEQKKVEKLTRLKENGMELAISWALCAVCLFGHVSHFLGTKAPFCLHSLNSVGFQMSLCFLTLVGPGRRIIQDGLRCLLSDAPNMNTLVGLGALSSFAVSSASALIPKLGWQTFFEEPIMLLAFVLLGRNLEYRAKLKATSDMSGLLGVLPTKAHLIVDTESPEAHSVVDIPSDALSIGDKIIVLPGDRVPADGIVTAGQSSVDESSFTGEPFPVTKTPGTEVTAGSINLNGKLTVEVRRPGGESFIADIVRFVEDAQNRVAPMQRLVDKVSGHFTYGVMSLSAATFSFWYFFGQHLFPAVASQNHAISLALQLSCTVLVVACPCALGLATPTAVLVGSSLGATNGLLVRGGDVFEKFSSVDTVVFDKTGTLTVGKPSVTKVVTLDEGSISKEFGLLDYYGGKKSLECELLTLAAGVESNTNHPVGKAIVEAAKVAGCMLLQVDDGSFIEEPGLGALGFIKNKKVVVGSAYWLVKHGVQGQAFHENHEANQESVAYVGVDGVLAGCIYVRDKIRDNAGRVISTLSELGISTYLLSGDKKQVAESVAHAVGIPKDMVFAGVRPNQKLNFISELQREKKIVAMVGDGINDAAALAAADVGIAMGGATGIASEASSVVLVGNKLSQLLDALELSKMTMKTIKENLLWAFAYNIVALPIAAGVLLPITGTMLTPSIAGALMSLSSAGVMANSLLLRMKYRARKEVYRSADNNAGSKSSLHIFSTGLGK